MLVDRVSFAQRVANLLAPVSGLDAVTEVPSADDITELRKTIRNFLAAGLRPTLPVSICVPEGAGIQHAGDIESNRQRKREQDRSANTRPTGMSTPGQHTQPIGRSPLDETLDALLGQ
jgi:hypothetical protein